MPDAQYGGANFESANIVDISMDVASPVNGPDVHSATGNELEVAGTDDL
jgi:hypothetical protein